MSRVLVVEDSTTDRRVVGFLFKRAGNWEVEYALHGKAALEQVEKTDFDLILTDLMMPAMDGLELVTAVRQRRPRVPVILMTSRGNEGIAMLALKAGAVSYIPKRLLPKQLEDTVSRVMAVSSRARSTNLSPGVLVEYHASLVLENEVAAIRGAIAYLQENVFLVGLCDEAECLRVGVALDEALTNALYHGNLEVGPWGIGDKEHQAVAAQRRSEPLYSRRRIHVTATLTPREGTFAIQDEGKGFNPTTLLGPTEISPLEKGSGRGVVLMRLFMDEVAFDSDGRRVVLIKRRPREHQPDAPARQDH